MSTKNIAFGEIANALKSTAADHILGVANDIYDENLGFYQSEINPKNVTYNELKSLRTNNQLVIGCHYKITDFVTTTAQSGTKSGNHAFDIIVKALDVNTLSEDAKACLHNGDTYFQSSNLDAWEIKYCLDNDTDRFSWVDTTNGKGVIYYMKDERGNIANYDFKNILFNKDATWLSNNSKIETTVGTLSGKEANGSIYFYTFTYIDNSSVVDCSLLDNIYNNDIKEYKNGGKTTLNNTIFIIHSSNAVFNNIIECNNYNNVLFASNGSISNNEINLKFHDNDIISDYFHTNIIGEEFFSNKISSAFQRNTIGIRCTSCSFNGPIGYTKFGDNVYYVNNSYPISYCEFGSYVQYCVFHNITSITPTYTEMKYCKIGNGNYGLQYIPSMQNVEIEDRCLYDDSNNFEIVNITLVNGERLIDKLIGENLVRLYVKKISGGGVSDTTNPAVISIFKNSDINSFYMGEFTSSGNAENAAAEASIALDFNKRFLRYYIPASNDNGFIEQIFYTSNNTTPQTVTTVQYQWWDGVKYKRTLVFTDGSRTSKSNWSKVYDITNGEDIFDGTKKFNGDIKLGDKTVIKGPNNIDSGELKVLFGGGSSKGFILRTQNSSASILPLQLLSTNGTNSYQYNFPTSTGGNVAIGATLDGTTNALASLTTGIIDLSSQTAPKATNIAGGAKGSIPYQSATNTTAMLGIGSEGQVLKVSSAGLPVWSSDNNTDTKNTAGSTNSASKLFLIGATSQGANPQTYSNSKIYATDGVLTATKFDGPLKGVSISDVNLGYSELVFKFYNNISGCTATEETGNKRYAGTANSYGFPVSNNANSMLWMGARSGNYGHQLGFSSNGNIYMRYISNGSFPTTANGGSWKALVTTTGSDPVFVAATTSEIQALFS